MHIIGYLISLVIGAFLGAYIYRNNSAKSNKVLTDLAAKVASGTEEAKAEALAILSNLKK